MAKLEQIEQISLEFVAAVRADWNGDLAFTNEALVAISDRDIDMVDVLEAVEDGVATNVRKDRPHETHIYLTHSCLTGQTLSICVAYDPHMPYLLVKEVCA